MTLTHHIGTLVVAPTIWTTSFVIILAYLTLRMSVTRRTSHNLPVIDCRQYSKQDQIFRIRLTKYDIIMLPTSMIGEVKNLPEEQISFGKEVQFRFAGKQTRLGAITLQKPFIDTLTKDMTRHTGIMTSEMLDEIVEYAIPTEIGLSKEWTAIPMFPKSLRIVAVITSRIFIGLPDSRDDHWTRVEYRYFEAALRLSRVNHTTQSFGASFELSKYPRWMRGFIAPFFQCIKDLEANRRVTRGFVQPRIEARLQHLKNIQPGERPPDDLLQWFLNNTAGHATDMNWHVEAQLGISVASIHTTGMLLTQCFFDIAAHPEYQTILRNELLDVLASERSNVIHKQTITKLQKMDSFIREVQRFAPVGLTTFNRLVTAKKGITLSNGLHLPYRSFVAAPSAQVAMDGDLWEDPETFDGLRFYKLRQLSGNEQRYQLVNTNTDHLLWGHGSHACPGRFFASNEIKLILMYMVLNYEMKLEDGKRRPSNIYYGTDVMPDPEARVLFRKREPEVQLLPAKDERMT